MDIYTDGSCYPNPNGNGGWAYILIENDALVYQQKGYDFNTTNNRMETMACIKALEYCLINSIKSPIIYSDSKLIVNYSSRGIGKKNRDLVNQLIAFNKTVCPKYVWIKGHSDIKWNEYVDSLASYKT